VAQVAGGCFANLAAWEDAVGRDKAAVFDMLSGAAASLESNRKEND